MNVLFDHSYKSRKLLIVSGQTHIPVTKEVLWNALIQKDHVVHFNPFVKEHQSARLVGIGHEDSCEYYNGKKLFRKVVEFKEQRITKFKVYYDKPEVNNFSVFEIIEGTSDNDVIFKLTLEFEAYKKIPRPIWYLIAPLILVPLYKKYIEAVVKGMHYYCTTGKKVERDQYGRHSQFS